MERESQPTSDDVVCDVFLSHSVKDREFVRHLAKDLVAAGLSVWLVQPDIMVGDSFADAIDKAIRASRFILIVMSPDYFQSAWTQQEWQYGLAEEVKADRIRLIPILYRDCEVPTTLRSKKWADFRDSGQYDSALLRLIYDLRSLASAEPPVRKITEAPRPGERVEQLDAGALDDLKRVIQDAVNAFKSRPDRPQELTSPSDMTPVDEDMCFIVMPFGVESLSVVYEDYVKPTLVGRCRLRPERGDDVFGSNMIMDDITKSIRKARLIVADLTGRNPNVLYEVGIAHALNKPVLLMTQSLDDVPFDLRHRRALMYEYTPRGCKKLEKDLYENVQSMLGRPIEA